MYCDYDKRVIGVDARWPGSVNDAYAFHASPIGDQCQKGVETDQGPMGKYVLLADSG